LLFPVQPFERRQHGRALGRILIGGN
jgi:hypothetical protein